MPRTRQTLFFSATLPKALLAVVGKTLKANYSLVDTVGDEETQTNVQVAQTYMMTPLKKQLPALLALLEKHAQTTPGYKTLVFCTTAKQTQLLAELFHRLQIPSLEMHSRLSQPVRERVAAKFRDASTGVVMFTSDVSARGVD